MKTQLILFACIFSLLVSCSSTKSSYTFVPRSDQNSLWRNGQSGVSDTAANLYSMVTAPAVSNEKLRFNMYFHNEGNEMLLIDPSTFYVHQTLNTGNVKGAFACTPEQLLAQYNEQVSARNGFIIFATLAAIVVGAAVIASSSHAKKTETPQQREENEKKEQLDRIEINQREQIELERSRQQQESSAKSVESDAVSDQQKEVNALQQQMLRKHSLLPNESISGLVVFPMLNDVNKVDLFVPVKDSATLKFSYDVLLK